MFITVIAVIFVILSYAELKPLWPLKDDSPLCARHRNLAKFSGTSAINAF